MAINAENSGSFTKELTPSGVHRATCYSMIHIGTVKETYLGEEKEINKVRITWELPDEVRTFKEENGPQPMSISKEFTLSMHEKATLRKTLKDWRGKDFTDEEAKKFDITTLVGKPCQLNVVHRTSAKGSVYAEVSGVMPLGKGTVAPDQVNPSFIFDYDPFDPSKFEVLPKFLQEKIITSVQYKNATEPKENQEVFTGDDKPLF